MTMTDGGQHICDRCGASCGNGGVRECAVVSDLDPENPGQVRNLHFCRDRTDEDGTEVKGCTRKLLNAGNLKHYTETQESSGD